MPGGQQPVELGQPVVDSQPQDDDARCWSVTTILGCIDKPALLYWSAEQTALAAIAQKNAWQAIERDSGTDEAVKWLTGARFRSPKGQRTAKDLGTEVHVACEQYALTGTRPEVDDEVRPFLDQFDKWLDRFQPEYVATEVTVYSPTYGYAGTADAFLNIDGHRLIVDYKTSKKSFDRAGKPTSPFPESCLQLAAYRWAELAAVWAPRKFESFRRRYYLISQAEQTLAMPVPETDGGAVIHITPEHCEIYPVRCDEEVHRAFLFVQEVARWQFQESHGAIGDPMVAPSKETPK